jgi:hypothetical protein
MTSQFLRQRSFIETTLLFELNKWMFYKIEEPCALLLLGPFLVSLAQKAWGCAIAQPHPNLIMSTPTIDLAKEWLDRFSLGHYVVDVCSAKLEPFPGHRPVSSWRITSLREMFLKSGPIKLSAVKAILHSPPEGLLAGGRIKGLHVSVFSGQHRIVALREWCEGDPNKMEEEGWWVFELFQPCEQMFSSFPLTPADGNLSQHRLPRQGPHLLDHTG